MSKICYVTAFYDLNRDKWPHFKRTFKEYLDSFLPLLPLLENEGNAECILFLDERHSIPILQSVSSVKVIVIKDTILNKLHCWSTLDTERRIMQSPEFKALIPNRTHFPEHTIPEYTLINHSKVDFIREAMKYTNAPYFCWIDFGYFALPERIPKRLLDLSLLDLSCINYTMINPYHPIYSNILYVLQKAPECIGGFFFFGSREKMIEYRQLYHKVLYMFQHEYGIADDDQHVALVCYTIQPKLFRLHHLGGWHRALTHFQIKS